MFTIYRVGDPFKKHNKWFIQICARDKYGYAYKEIIPAQKEIRNNPIVLLGQKITKGEST